MKLAMIVLVLFGVLMTGSLGARADSGNPFGFETNTHPLKYEYCKKEPGLRGGSVILNSLWTVDKWLSALVMPPPGWA